MTTTENGLAYSDRMGIPPIKKKPGRKPASAELDLEAIKAENDSLRRRQAARMARQATARRMYLEGQIQMLQDELAIVTADEKRWKGVAEA